jgi:putative acetyltransferase
MTIEPADFADPELLDLLRLHLDGMYATSPPESVHALDLSGLQTPDVTLFVVRIDGRVAGMGGLKELDPAWGEIKSMRTHPDFLRRGLAAAILEHLLSEARRRGYRRLSLETGTGEAFEAAVQLYHRYGFRDGGKFAQYTDDPFSRYMHLTFAGN